MGQMREHCCKHKEGLLYLFCGGLTVIVSWLSYSIFVEMSIGLNLSNILSWFLAVCFAYVVNKWYVFESRSLETQTVIREMGSFFAARIFTGLITFICFPILLQLGLEQGVIEGLPAKIAVSSIEIVINYIASKYYIFKKC